MATQNCSSRCISAASSVRLLRPCTLTRPSEESPITNLEDDLLVEILIRLPNPRHACRCKAVCKRWACLISSPSFNRPFVSHHHSRYQPLFFSNQDSQSAIQSFLPAMPNEEAGRRFVAWDSSMDLVLCGFSDRSFPNDELGRTYIVCNPFTKQWIALPLAPEKITGYIVPGARLVVQPRISSDLDLGDGKVFDFHSKHRFKVVIMYTHTSSIRIDMFCSESREWRKEALVLDRAWGLLEMKLVSHNGALFFSCSKLHAGRGRILLVALDPFRDRMPLTYYVDASPIMEVNKATKFAISQGALHLVAFEQHTSPGCLTVWRLEEDGKSWRKRYEASLNTRSSTRSNYQLEQFSLGTLHPEKPEIVFLQYWDPRDEDRTGIYSCDLTRMAGGGEIEFFAVVRLNVPCWRVLQPRVPCWPTPIPRYEELQGMYNGSYNCWFQCSEVTTLSILEEYQSFDDLVAQFAPRRKGKRSASSPLRRTCGVRKPKKVNG